MSTARVDFTRGAAERIARAVRIVEQGERDLTGPRSRTLPADSFGSRRGEATFRVCVFTGSWGINSLKTVQFKFQDSTPNTVQAMNLFANISLDCGARDCAIAKDGDNWYLVSAKCS